MEKRNIISLTLAIVLTIGITINNVNTNAAPLAVMTAPAQQPVVAYTSVNALDVVANPYSYLNKNIKIKAKFDKFSTLGLDYAPAMRSSEKYISFLIQRPDITNHNIPLSELKIFLDKDIAEKNIDLDAGDEVEFTGRVFSTALGDPWMDVDNFKVLTKKEPKKDTQNQ